jgi:surfactin synthase thioesterase subunit/glycosyltransferase involved in cell wall biosynthesis
MRILLAASASYHPPKGGSTRSNLVWLRALAGKGHEVLIVCGADSPAGGEILVDGLRIRPFPNLNREGFRLQEAIAGFAPDFVLVSSEDLSHNLLREAHKAARHRLVYLAHTPQWFPFGPEAWYPDAAASKLLLDALAIVAIGESTARYIERHLGRLPNIVHPALYGDAPWPLFSNFHRRTALLINPSTVKGLPIFLALADRHPGIQFLALRGWGTTPQDLEALRARPNVEVLDTVADIDTVFARASVLLAPSLWYEGFGLVVTEAMLRGIPALAADHGGLKDAAHASSFRLPVAPIERWLPDMDATGMPLAELPPQPLEPWSQALLKLLDDPAAYEAESRLSRDSAAALASSVSPDDLEALLLTLRPSPKRILLVHNSLYYPGAGGGDKSNRLLMEAFAELGHAVQVFTRLESFGPSAHNAYVQELRKRGIAFQEHARGLTFTRNQVNVDVVSRETNLRAALRDSIDSFRPDIIFCSTDDPAHLFFETALRHSSARVVFLVRATIALPFGGDASTLNAERTERLKEADAVLCVSEYVARYCREQGGLDAIHLPISLPDHRQPPDVGRYGNPYVTLINPSDVKGLPILLGLADALPEIDFAAVPSWGTTPKDLTALRARSNITLLDPVEDITEVLKLTRVTLVPSLWAEARSRMVLESLSRGVPVLASDVGGLREAMCGVDYVLPVNPILKYRPAVSEQMVPEAEVPAQDLGPWVEALSHVLRTESNWSALSRQGREAGLAYLNSISAKPIDAKMDDLLRRPKRAPSAARAMNSLSPVKRRLLAVRIQQAASRRGSAIFARQWGNPAGTPVYLFPWAGATPVSWDFLDASEFHFTAIQPPSHGTFVERADAIVQAFRQSPPTPNALFCGHSMGAALAFEVARQIPPSALVVSSCRAPHLRQGWVPPPAPDAAQLKDDLVSLGGLTRQEAESLPPSLIEALQADLDSFRNYQYTPAAPLSIPITALCGNSEPHLSPDQVEAWRAETKGTFRFESISGSHFWLKQNPSRLLDALREHAT